MADELPQAGVESGEKETPQATETSSPEQVGGQGAETEKPEASTEESTGEPGGKDGQSVYQRKLYRENKQLRQRVSNDEIEKARLEERLKVLEEQGKSKGPRRYTPQEISDAIQAGTISQAEGLQYLARTEAADEVERRDRAKGQAEAIQRPVQKASEEIGRYVQAAPWLSDDSDERTQNVAVRYHSLLTDYGLPANEVTKALAIREVLGPIDRLQKQREAANLTARSTATHTASPAGGSGTERGSADAVSKVPKEMVDYWRSTGATEDQVKTYAAHHISKIEARRARFGG